MKGSARGKFVGPDLPLPVRTDWNHVARLARRQPEPGSWYQVPGLHSRAVASHVRAGRMPAFRPAGSWQARYANTDDPRLVVLFVRPNPDTDDESAC